MRLKSFHGVTMADAMAQVRQALGDDAIIVATRDENNGVRVTAAIEELETPAPRAPGAPDGSGGAALQMPEAEETVTDRIEQVLHKHGTPAALIERLAESMLGNGSSDPQVLLSSALDANFRFDPMEDALVDPPRPLMMVGPPGAGKTVSIAKLAARATLAGQKVGMISTDIVRAGGIDQLQAFAKRLKVRLVVSDDPYALTDAIQVLEGSDLILIDTTGSNPFDESDMAGLKEQLRGVALDPILVVPAGGDVGEAAEIAASFHQIGVRRLMPTKLDITRRLGSVMSAADGGRMAFFACGNTPRVADGLLSLSPATLAKLILPKQERVGAQRVQQTGT